MMKVFFLFCTLCVAISAKSIATSSDEASSIDPIIKQLLEQKDVAKLCAIRQELEHNSENMNNSDLVKFLDNNAAFELGFPPVDCAKAPDIEVREVEGKQFDDLEEERDGNTGGNKELGLDSFVENEDQNLSKDPAFVLALRKSDNDEDPVKSLADLFDDLESSRVTEERAKIDNRSNDFDFSSVDSSLTSTDFECNNCSSERNVTLEFTSTFEDAEQTFMEAYKLIGIGIGVAVLAIVILVAIIYLVCWCKSFCSSKNEIATEYYRPNINNAF